MSPVPLLLNSGDIVIMSGPSRLAYHGVPRVLTPSSTHTVPYCLRREQLENCACTKTRGTKSESELTTVKVSRRKDEHVTECGKNSACQEACPVCYQLANLWNMFVEYLSVSRININVRQVVSETFKFET